MRSKYRIYIMVVMLLCGVYAHAVKVVFRLDDPTVQYDSVHNRILQLFAEKDVPLSVAVIPCDSNENAYEPNDSAYLALLNAPNIEVCLHGFTHTHTHITRRIWESRCGRDMQAFAKR